jgi:parallel beta-helix repeat protein
MPEEILMPETAKIIYECALDFNISGNTERAMHCVEFSRKIHELSNTHLTKGDLSTMFSHQIPLPESVRRFILYSCLSPLDTADSSTFNKNNRTGSKSKMEQMHAEGKRYFNNGKFQKAVEMYSSAMAEVSLFDPKLLCDRALAYINLQQYENALADSKSYLSDHSKCWFGLAIKALALHGLNKIWEASRFAALAFYYNRDIFCDFQPFENTFSALKERMFICNCSSLLTDSLLSVVPDLQGAFEYPSKIVLLEPGDYLLNVHRLPCKKFELLGLQILLSNCILLGVESSKSSVVMHFYEDGKFASGITSNRRVMVANVSFVFLKGNWETEVDSVATFLNCSFRSSLDESNYTFHSLGIDTFRNCSFDNCKSPGLIVHGKANVEKCVFSGGEFSGVAVHDGGYLEMKECKIFGHNDGVYVQKAVKMCNVQNCEIFDNKRHGIMVTENSSNVRVENCRIYQNDCYGIHVRENSSAFISRNEIFENKWQGISSALNGRCTISHNRIYRNKSGGVLVAPVDSRKLTAPSVVEFNEIFENSGLAINDEMVLEDVLLDTNITEFSGKSFELKKDYMENSEYFLEPKCTGNECYNNNTIVSTATSKESTVGADFCSFCRTKCSSNCSKCFVTAYCNRECQRSDWKKHKKECGSILNKVTVPVDVSPNEDLDNIEFDPFVPGLPPQYPGLAPKGPNHAPKPKSGERFLVKIIAADEEYHMYAVHGALFGICDRSLTINGRLDRKCYPQMFNMVRECGVSSRLVEGWKKKFFWAKMDDENYSKLRVFTTKFPGHQDW